MYRFEYKGLECGQRSTHRILPTEIRYSVRLTDRIMDVIATVERFTLKQNR